MVREDMQLKRGGREGESDEGKARGGCEERRKLGRMEGIKGEEREGVKGRERGGRDG